MRPKVTVITVNYNSSRKWSVIKHSLESVLSLEYRPLEVLIVDNGSDDGSYERIIELVGTLKRDKNVEVRVIRLSRNYGFAFANIIAYRLRSSDTKYIALINNDLAPEPDSLEALVRVLESHPKIAGIQGAILTWDGKYVDSYGCMMANHGTTYAVGFGMDSAIINSLKPIAVTYADGAYSVYRVEAIEKCGGLFMPYFFMWGDDYELGIRLWRCGYIIVALPVVAGKHCRGATTSSSNGRDSLQPPTLPPTLRRWKLSSNVAVIVLYGRPWIVQLLLKTLPITLARSFVERNKLILRGLLDGIKLGLKLRKKMPPDHKFMKEPMIRVGLVDVLKEVTLLTKNYLRYGPRTLQAYRLAVTRSLGEKALSKHGIPCTLATLLKDLQE